MAMYYLNKFLIHIVKKHIITAFLIFTSFPINFMREFAFTILLIFFFSNPLYNMMTHDVNFYFNTLRGISDT